MNKNIKLFLLLIVLFGFLLRIWNLGFVPPSPDWDEASLGYNAYSIMQTGKDEYGKTMPLITRSFDDYKPALYMYTIIPFIELFGLNLFAVRLPSVIFGTLAIIAAFFIVKELFNLNRSEQIRKWVNIDYIAFLSAFLLAISPWHIQFSRIAFESNMGLTFNIFAILFFLKGLKKPIFLCFASTLAALNFYVYQSEKVFTPLIFLALIIIFRKEIFSVSRKYLAFAIGLGILISIPLLTFTFTNKEALSRAKGVSIFSDQTPFLKQNVIRLQNDINNNDLLGLILDNRRILYAKAIASGYLSHFDLNWLFITGDLARHHAPNMGIMYLFELPFLLIGIYFLIFGNFPRKAKLVIFSWFLIAPIPASITSGVPHAIRTLNFLPTFQIFTALGVLFFISAILNMKYEILKIQIKYLIFCFFFLFFVFNFSYYLNQYFVQQNYYHSEDWQYGYNEAVSKVKDIEKDYDKIVVSNKPHLDQSYMFFLFYLKYSPALYQEEAKQSSGGFRENHKFGKYEFRPIEWDKEVKDSKILYVGRPDDFPQNAVSLDTINFLNNKPAIKVVKGSS